MARPTPVILLLAATALACAPEPDVVSVSADPSAPATVTTTTPADPRVGDGADRDPAPSEGASPDPPAPPDDTTHTPTTVADTRPTPPEPVVLRPTPIDEVAEVGPFKPDRAYDDIVAVALVDLEEWMAVEHPRLHGRAWEPLSGGVWPSYPGRTDIPGCGEPSTDPADVNEYVAFYCAGGDFLVYDDGPDSLLGQLADEFGPSVLGVVLAHEYGHVVQDRLGDLDRRLPTILTEQQADCVAGAWIARALHEGSPHLRLGHDDLRGALITMVAVRDPVGIDQFLPGGHGTAFDRIGAFHVGFADGLDRCTELLDDPLPLMPNQFVSTADMANDGDLPFGYGPGDIVPLVVRSLDAYWSHAFAESGVFDAARGDQPGFADLILVPVETPIPCPDGPAVEVTIGLVLCPTASTVLLDDRVARDLYRDPIIGRADFAVGYLVGLAWAEMAQQLLASELEGAERTLANDCLVGAWTADLDPQRPDRPGETDRAVISPGDLDEAVVAAIELSDADPTVDRLGLPLDKIDAFRRGVLGGLDPCLELIRR